MPTLIVKGKVVTVDGEPLERKIVEVRPRLSAAVYGTAATTLTDGGNYMATLSTTTAGSGSTFDVEVVVCELDNTEIGRSVLLYDVAGEITVDIVVGAADYRGRSDFRRIEARIDPLRGSLAVDELGSEHIEYLSAKLDMDPLRIAQYIQAHRMSVLLDTVPAWAFYALLRQGLPAEVPQLLAQGRPVHEGGLAAAIAGNVIADPGEPTLNAVLDELQAQAAESAVWAHPTDPDAKSKFRRLLDTAAGPEASYTVQLAFMEKHLAHTGTLAEFWDAVDADIDLGPTVRATYEWTLQINTLANEHMPLITALQAKRADIGDPIKSFRDLSALDVADWVDLLSSGIGAPASIPLDWPEEDRILRYAETIERIVTDTYPTTVIHRRIVRDHTASPGSIAGAPDLIQFFDDNPAFELSPHELDAYLADHPTALDNVTDAAATRANLKKLQRLARLAPRGFQYRVLKPLYQAGLHSALQIGRMTEKSFVRKYGTNLGGDDIARSVYQRARMSAGIALMVATQFARGFNKTPISVVPSSTLPDYEGHPDLEALFGNLDFCACDHCRSVYSATAYFVDLLQFLKDQPGKDAGSNALDALMERRPELTAIELSCINTNTEVPYIDLVNELLEYHVSRHANAPLAVSSSFWQTTWTAEELAVRPEHQLSQAYNVALDTPYPFGLPFDLAFAETSLYHQSFDVSRERMENAYPHNDPDYADRRARARLGLDLMSWYVIINSGLISWSPRAFWGGETADEPQPPDWWTPLRTVSTFLKRAEIDISELAALLRTRFIGRAGLSISYAAPPDDCNLDEAEILTLGEADLGKIHRFIRLQRKIGWTADELDLALRTLSGDPPALDGASVRKLAVVHRLSERLKLPIEVLLTFWIKLPTRAPASDPTKPSYYVARFIDRVLEGSAATNFALNGEQTEQLVDLADTSGTLDAEDRISTVQSALGISGEQVLLLADWLGPQLPGAGVTLAQLSRAHRRTVLARALGVSLAELRRLMDLVGISPFREDGSVPTEANLANTEQFLDAVDAIRSSAFTSEQIAYLLKHTMPLTPGIAPRPEVRTLTLKDLAVGLAAIADKYSFTPDTLGEVLLVAQLRDTLTEFLDPEELTAAMMLIDGSSSELEAAQEARVVGQFDPDNTTPLGIFSDTNDAKAKLVTAGGTLTALVARYEYVLSRLYPAVRARSSRELVVQRLAQHFGLAVDSMQALLSQYLTTPTPLLTLFSGAQLLTNGEPNSAAIYAYERVHKAARVVAGFGFDAAHLQYLYVGGSSGWLDVDDLPSGGGVVTPVAFAKWKRLYDVTRARSLFPHHPSTLADLRAASGSDIVAIIAGRLGWEAMDVSIAISSVHALTDAAFDDEVGLLKVVETVTVARQLLTPVRNVKMWAENEPTTGQALEMRKALRGRYDDSTWRQTARSIQDVLRIQQRDALVACLIARGIAPAPVTRIADADALYAYLLVDVEMSVCMITSRIRFALNSVQQFIQRVFLSLESSLTFDEDATEEWKWMKHYRVWEANRKVFLYPENWVEPGLRDDKSPFFRELEETLLQGDVTKSLAEKAYVTYLEKLQEVALPEVMGMYHEHEVVNKEVRANDLHVVARTGHGPFRHYYRKYQDLNRWTAWETMPGDVQGEHILPFVYGGRLYVFWVEFQIESIPPKEGVVATQNNDATTPPKQLVARLFWIERRDGVWTSRFHAEGCVLILGPSVNETVESARADYSCSAAEDSDADALDITVAQTSYDVNKMATLFEAKGRFRLRPMLGKFVAEPSGWQISTSPFFTATRRAQLWTGEVKHVPKFSLYSEDEKQWHSLTLFDPSQLRMSYLFPHDNPKARVNPGGFFASGEHHRFYIAPRLGGGNQNSFRSLPNNGSGLNKPSVDSSEFFPWRVYGFLSGRRPTPATEYSPNLTQKKLAADALHVPLKWNGSIPGLKTYLEGDVLSGTSAAKLALHQSLAADVLGNVPTPQMYHTPPGGDEPMLDIFLFQHSYVGMLLGHIRRYQVEGLLRPDSSDGLSRQNVYNVAVPSVGGYNEAIHDYRPGDQLNVPFPHLYDDFDFSYSGPFSLYNWEIFFHAPLLIAQFLSRQGRYEEADSWLRGIFDPTSTSGFYPERFWRIKPFYNAAPIESIDALLLILQGDAENSTARSELERQIKDWRDNPFNPHLLARMRNGTYQRATVMQYLDNLIAWGDARFAEDTIESINEATQIYMLARAILGDRPAEVKKTTTPAARTFAELEDDLDSFSNALVELETKSNGNTPDPNAPPKRPPPPAPKFWYFCVPANPELLAYWDVVEDRLFKIRHCQDIHGVERRLALFDPPIDPGQIVKALAGGGDLASALSQLAGRAPVYRFQMYLSKAYELASEVKALGSGLLQAYEKRDAEELSLLRSQHERSVLALSRAIKLAQIDEANQGLLAAQSARPITEARQAYYKGLVDTGWLASEQAQVDLQQIAMKATLDAGLASLLGSELGLIPNFDFGVEGLSSPVIKASFGGAQLAAVAGMFAGILQTVSSYSSMASGLAGTNAGFERRLEDWKQQVANAELELKQIDQQIESSRARKIVAEKELSAHDLQIENAAVADAFMRSKYTNGELYGWMISKISSLYKQAYELAYRAAVAAEKAYQYELHSDESFIGFGYWDQSRSGLLAGEILALDLRRLDAAYLDNNRREYELTKRISLAQLDPYALVQLRETGSCYLSVPEFIFDLDHPGHYLRRIKMVSVALPGVTGPHVSVGCTLMLESSKVRVKPSNPSEYQEDPGVDSRFTYRVGKVEQVVTSGGQDSTGMFESNINDPRYLPFEGAGVIGTWKIDLPPENRQFNYRSIADVVISMQYTAREGGGALRDGALAATVPSANAYKNIANNEGSALILRAATDFSASWNTFLYGETASPTRQFSMDIVAQRFPYLAANWPNLAITAVQLILVTDVSATAPGVMLKYDGVDIEAKSLVPGVPHGLPTARWDGFTNNPGAWQVSLAGVNIPNAYKQEYAIDGTTYTRFKDGMIRDMLVIVHYNLPVPP